MNKMKLFFVLVLLFVSAVFFIGCGQSGTSSYSYVQPAGNFRIKGNLSSLSPASINQAGVLNVTNIIAIGSDGVKYMADFNPSTETFSISVNTGIPYAVGFYNQSNDKITLLGYLKQNDFNWHSLPLMTTTTTETNLGTVEINAASVEAVPSVGLNDLLSAVSMNSAEANLYGNVDGLMTQFTNVDVNNNGVFDFMENKAYLLQIVIGTNIGSTTQSMTGEVDKMLNHYNDTYYPIPSQYEIIFHAAEEGATLPADGTAGTIKYPTTIYDSTHTPKTQDTGTVWGSSGKFWSFMRQMGGIASPSVIPSGSYTFEVTGKGSYTFSNVEGAPLAAVGTTEGLIFPIFQMETDEAGYVTKIDYKWMIREDGITREATPDEVKAIIVDSSLNSNHATLVEPSPSLGVVLDHYPSINPAADPNDPNYRAPLKIDRDSNSVDTKAWNVRFDRIAMFACNYKINSDLSLSFMFGK